jgi:hypothetical protein
MLLGFGIEKHFIVHRLPTSEEKEIGNKAYDLVYPSEKMQENSAGGDTLSWGTNTWG